MSNPPVPGVISRLMDADLWTNGAGEYLLERPVPEGLVAVVHGPEPLRAGADLTPQEVSDVMTVIHEMRADDAPRVAALCEQLGYPASPEQIVDRLTALSQRPENGLYVAAVDAGVAGWVHVYGVHLLASPAPFAEIGGLVVDARVRRRGVGQALMSEAEGWARAHGYREVRLRSGLHRTEAHEFYQHIGYALAKTSHMFRKDLGTTP